MCWLLLSCICMYCRLKIEYLFLAHTLTMSFITLLYAHSYPAHCSQGFLNPFSSVQSLSCVQLFESHELQHARPPCPSPIPRVHPNSYASSRWCHPAISSSVIPFSSCPHPSQHEQNISLKCFVQGLWPTVFQVVWQHHFSKHLWQGCCKEWWFHLIISIWCRWCSLEAM